ncbi:MAG: LamG-like jellyroll fold domain-containing protein, partial [Verrucomicrobiota bacterium]
IADGATITALASRPGSIKHTVASAGGWPVLAVNTTTHTYPINPNSDDDSDGYTNIEEWLHAKSAAVENAIDPPTPQFDNFQDGNANGWAPDGGIWGMTGSFAYQQSDNTQSAVRSVLNATSWTDQLVEADVNATSFNGANRFFGIVARYKEPANYYYLVLRNNNTWELKTLINNTSATLASGAATVTTGTWYTLSLEVIGSTLKGYLNGVLLGTGTDSTHTSGRTALLTYLTSAQFDNVVADPNPGAVNAPLSLSATVAAAPNNIGTINLAWDNVTNETGYKVERKKGASGSWSQIGTTGTDVVTFGDNTCGAGTQYFYRVRATNAGGDSVYSAEANATTAEVTSGRQAHWKLDENAGTSAADGSGNSNTGTLSTYGSGLPTWVTGKIGSALDFDASDDVVTAGSGASLDNLVAQGGAGMTIAAWIKPDTIGEGGSPGRIVHKGTGTSPVAGWQFVTQAPNTIAFAADHGTTDLNRVAANSALGATLGVWKHVVVTWTGSATATNVKLYVDGVETAYGTTTNGGAARVPDESSSVFIGSDNTGVRTFDGVIDDVRIYNRVITVAELAAIHRAGL